MRRTRMAVSSSLSKLIMLSAVIAAAGPVYADDRPSQKAIDHASKFLESESTGRYVLGFVHMGAQYNSHELASVRTVVRRGTTVPGHFALVYDYKWEGDGSTELAFLCDQRGNVYDVQVLKSNGVLNSPYTLAKLSIDILGNALLEAFKDNMSSSDRAQLQTLVRNSDPEALLEMGLKLRQAFTR